jgi:hypothetical protein
MKVDARDGIRAFWGSKFSRAKPTSCCSALRGMCSRVRPDVGIEIAIDTGAFHPKRCGPYEVCPTSRLGVRLPMDAARVPSFLFGATLLR